MKSLLKAGNEMSFKDSFIKYYDDGVSIYNIAHSATLVT